jgi:hypothetical protein
MAFGCENWYDWFNVDMPGSLFAVGGQENIALDYTNPNETPGDLKTGYYLSKTRKIMNMVDVVNYHQEIRKFIKLLTSNTSKADQRVDSIRYKPLSTRSCVVKAKMVSLLE